MKHNIRITFEGDEPQIEGMPENYVKEYLAIDTQRILYFVDRPENHKEGDRSVYDTFCVFVGSGDQMRQAKLLSADRYRDGGTTEINFDLEGKVGRLSFPPFFSPENKAVRCLGSVTYVGIRLNINPLRVLYDPAGWVAEDARPL